ncbi:DUF2637 domain-containing protein [Streptomyces sp. NBC_01233]|uniref:DUF2637 domain-containing protein n=1 Tax=Streptomyces sp. NBC_01233 TaxID=2903787 RepID=UPI002E148C1F|nr:DUF2637 domain-containing protein [Streptomyces sp. NBC_01233]
MITTMEPGVHAPAPTRTDPPSRTPAVPSPTPAPASTTVADAPAQAPAATPQTTRRASIALGLVCLFFAPFVAFVGFYLSFGNLSMAGFERFGFPTMNKAKLFAGGVDGAIVLFLAADLFAVSRGRRAYRLLRPMAHVMTGATIWFNATAHGPVLDNLDKALPHAAMPILFVVCVEAGRDYLVQAASLEMGLGRQSAPLARWFLDPRTTFAMWSRMKQWDKTYDEAMDLERRRAIYGVWLEHREELEAGHEDGQVSVLDKLPMKMKKFGLTVEEALALPDQMKADDQKRRQQAAAAKLQLELAEEKADAEAEKERLRVQGEIDRVRASVNADTGIAEARAEAATAGARLEATTALTAAQRAADAAEREAAAEAAAEESAKVATERAKEKAALAKVAEDDARVLEAERKKAEESAKLAVEQAKEKAALAKVVEDEARVLEGQRKVAEESARIEQARHAAAQDAVRAAEAESLASLSARDLRERIVARFLIDSLPIETVRSLAPENLAKQIQTLPITNAKIGELIGGASDSTASSHKTAAVELIARGYNHHTGYDPDLTAQ